MQNRMFTSEFLSLEHWAGKSMPLSHHQGSSSGESSNKIPGFAVVAVVVEVFLSQALPIKPPGLMCEPSY